MLRGFLCDAQNILIVCTTKVKQKKSITKLTYMIVFFVDVIFIEHKLRVRITR